MSGSGPRCVVIGAGHAAAQLCVSLTDAGWPGSITVIGDEPHAPYHRPPLSKTYLSPSAPEPLQWIRPAQFYRDHDITLMLGERVASIDRATKSVHLAQGAVEYDLLVLATGSRHSRPPLPGIDHPNVLTLQTAGQAELMRGRLRPQTSVIVIGGGFIGLEVAASLRKHETQVVVLERADRVLSRVTSPQVSHYFEALHRQHGVDLHTSVNVTAVAEEAGPMVVRTEAGDAFPADFVVVGAGAAANAELAKAAGLAVSNGIEVDQHNRTSDPAIYAMGDCCNQHHPRYGLRLRLESVQNALEQAKTVAASILEQPRAHDVLPWFWSDQYDVKLQTVGISTGYDQCLTRGEAEPGQPFSAWYFRAGRLVAVDAVNDSRMYAVAGKLLQAGLCPARALIGDSAVTAKMLLQSAQENPHAQAS